MPAFPAATLSSGAFFFSSRRRHTRCGRDWSSDVCSSDLRGRGFDCSAEDVLITTGSQQALDLIAHTLLDPGDVVLVELPTYIGGSSSFFARSATLAGVARSEERRVGKECGCRGVSCQSKR